MDVFDEGIEAQEDTQKGKYLKVAVDSEAYGMAIKYVIEIISIQAITQIPDVPDYLKGIINVRGKIIPVVDLRIKFGRPAADYNDRTSIAIVDIQNTLIGLIVDHVFEVVNIEEEQINPPPTAAGSHNQFISGIGTIGDAMLLVIDCEKLLTANKEK